MQFESAFLKNTNMVLAHFSFQTDEYFSSEIIINLTIVNRNNIVIFV